ncbi:hypothetical protein SCLCIDRAFT_420792 [Scleroderma citrinum Foug A]|uniref:Uncharacterized protein n=1 Tax=Scleroderma citrinum Foug A TaxID=1036808 RepID=A0A0C2ZWM2_9AGAM|nr:hypothetical protein SCLCIDRAFT_420792 [Scleroderma citrinum Foug A]
MRISSQWVRRSTLIQSMSSCLLYLSCTCHWSTSMTLELRRAQFHIHTQRASASRVSGQSKVTATEVWRVRGTFVTSHEGFTPQIHQTAFCSPLSQFGGVASVMVHVHEC